MRTKDPKYIPADYGLVSRLSIQRDFKNASFRQTKESNIKRVVGLSETSAYAKYKRYIIGKLVRVIGPARMGGYYVEFVRPEDSAVLNGVAGWNDKTQYLLDGAKFDR